MSNLSLPLHASINIISKCNMNCIYCYAQPFNNEMIPLNKLIELVEYLHHGGVFIIIIGGGEPFLHPNIFDFLEYVTQHQISIALVTNGTLLDKPKMKQLANIMHNNSFLNIQISLDSIDEKINEITRGNTKDCIYNIDYLCSLGVDLQIASVINKFNMEKMEELINYFYPRVNRYHFMNIMPTPKALECFSHIIPNKKDLSEFWHKKIFDIKQRFGEDLQLSAVRDMEDKKKTKDYNESCYAEGCLAGTTFIDIDANLDVIPCNCARSFVIGNLKRNSLVEIWNSKEIKKIRNITIPLCYYYAGNQPHLHINIFED